MNSNTTACGRILLVDDNVDAVEMMQLLLTSPGYDVDIAHSGEDGLALARNLLPQGVFSDIGMPGMSGYEFAVELRRAPRLKDVFLLALTGGNNQATREGVLAAGFDRHLVKPAKFDEILAILLENFSMRQEEVASSSQTASGDMPAEPAGSGADFLHE